MPDAWPGTLPAFSIAERWKEEPADGFIRTEMDAGPAKVRKRSDAEPDKVTFNQILDTTECTALDTFYVTTLKSGTLPFDEEHPRTGTLNTWRFLKQPTKENIGGPNYRVGYEVEIVG